MKKLISFLIVLILFLPLFSDNIKDYFKSGQSQILQPVLSGFSQNEADWLPDAVKNALTSKLKSNFGIIPVKNSKTAVTFQFSTTITKNEGYILTVELKNIKTNEKFSISSSKYPYVGAMYTNRYAIDEVLENMKNSIETKVFGETSTPEISFKDDDYKFASNEFKLGMDYMFYLEWAGYNQKQFFDYAHGLAINFDYRLYFPVSGISFIGFGFNLDIGFPFGIRTNMDGQKNVIRRTNSGLQSLITEYSIGFASKHLCATHLWFEWYAGFKVGVFNASYKSSKTNEMTSIYNMTIGIQGEAQVTYFFYKWLGIAGGIRIDYDPFSLARFYYPDQYSYLQVLVIKPFVSAKFKI